MSNKRDFKKTINYVCTELFAECVAASLYGGKINKENCDALLASILRIHSDFISRVSHPEPGMKQKDYYKNVQQDFGKQVAEIADQITNLS